VTLAKTTVLMIGETGIISTDCTLHGLEHDEFEKSLLPSREACVHTADRRPPGLSKTWERSL